MRSSSFLHYKLGLWDFSRFTTVHVQKERYKRREEEQADVVDALSGQFGEGKRVILCQNPYVETLRMVVEIYKIYMLLTMVHLRSLKHKQ